MKKSLLLTAALCATMASLAQTYNYFDAADVDKDGWLWFDTQAKIDKYVGFGKDFKIQLQPVGYEDENFQYAEPWCDPEYPGYNLAGEEGGDGARFGAVVLNQGTKANGSDNPDGGGFMLWLPDCAKFDVFLSSATDVMNVGLKAGMGDWVKPVDCALVKTWMKVGSWIKPLATQFQFEFDDIQNYANQNAPYTTIASEKGKKVTALFTNNGPELYMHGIRVYTYTEAADNTGIEGIAADGEIAISIDNGMVKTNKAAEISVYDMAGNLVAAAAGTTLAVDAPAGVYIVKAKSANASTTAKIRL